MNELREITQIFMLPSTFLVVALGAARTEPLKVGVSALGLVSGILWGIGAFGIDEQSMGTGLRAILQWVVPWVFCFAWLGSLIIHIANWSGERSRTARSLSRDLS